MKTSSILATIGLSLACGTASANVMFFDFGNTNRQSDPNMFNNFVPAVSLIADAIDENGISTGVSVEIVDPFFTTGEPSQLGSEAPSGDAAQFGVDATDDYFFGHTTPFAGAEPNPLGIVEFRNLDANTLYTFTIFASRQTVNDTREAQYEVTGANNASGLLNASNNDSNVLVLANIMADGAGTISLSVSPGPNNDNGNGFYYLGAIRVDAIPSPGSAALFGTAGLFLSRRRRTIHE